MRQRQITLVGQRFGLVVQIRPDVDGAGRVILCRPQARYLNRRGLLPHAFGRGAFCRFRIPADYGQPGVYVLTRGSRVVYVGKCDDLAWRFNAGYGNIAPRATFANGQTTNCKVNKAIMRSVRAGQRVRLWFKRTTKQSAIENLLIEELQPEWNVQGR